MSVHINLICCIVFCGLVANCQEAGILSNDDDVRYGVENKEGDNILPDTNKQLSSSPRDRVEIKLYYECMCPFCRTFDIESLVPVVQKLGQYIDLHTYPYGNAKTTNNNGEYNITCQHGPEECYGNKLHACSIDIINNITTAVLFNACMMEQEQSTSGSDDAAATNCGNRMSINSEPIKECAKSETGFQLLKYYGEETNKVSFKGVPYVLLNGEDYQRDNFMHDVCAAFTKPPAECKNQ